MSAEDLEAARRSLIAATATLDWYDTKSQWDSVRANILEERRRIAELFMEIHVIEVKTASDSTGDGAEESIGDPSQGKDSQRLRRDVESILPLFGMPRTACDKPQQHTPHVWGGNTTLDRWCNGAGLPFAPLDATDTAD